MRAPFLVCLAALAAAVLVRGALAAEPVTLTVYTSLEKEHLDKYAQRFYEAHPQIRIEWLRETTGVLTDRILAEKAARRAFESVRVGVKVEKMATAGKKIKVHMQVGGKPVEELYDKVLVSVGRVPNTFDLGLKNTKATVDEKALRVIESDGLILLPVSTFDRDTGQFVELLQLIGLEPRRLRERGSIDHRGLVRRADLLDTRGIPVDQEHGFGTGMCAVGQPGLHEQEVRQVGRGHEPFLAVDAVAFTGTRRGGVDDHVGP